jgi:VanZ family protein
MAAISKLDTGSGRMRLMGPLRWCLFVGVLAIVYWLGTSLFSAARMEPLVYPVFRSLGANGDAQLFSYLTVVRLSAHYGEYFVLFVLLVWVLGMRPLTALIVCVLLAGADEGHQYFLPDRSCSLRDIKFDAAGAATAFILVAAARRWRSAPALQNAPGAEQTGPASA